MVAAWHGSYFSRDAGQISTVRLGDSSEKPTPLIENFNCGLGYRPIDRTTVGYFGVALAQTIHVGGSKASISLIRTLHPDGQ